MPTDRRHLLTWAFALALAVLVVLQRVAPYWFADRQHLLWNLMPVGALALLAGAQLGTWWAIVLPLATMLVADLLLIAPLAAMDPPWPSFTWGTPFIYAAFALYFVLGHVLRPSVATPLTLAVSTVLGGALFFLVTNAGSWIVNLDGRYLPGLDGLMQSYAAALPFYRGTLTSDLVFSAAFFGGHALLMAALPQPREEVQPA